MESESLTIAGESTSWDRRKYAVISTGEPRELSLRCSIRDINCGNELRHS